jgi:hypothetical protein
VSENDVRPVDDERDESVDEAADEASDAGEDTEDTEGHGYKGW